MTIKIIMGGFGVGKTHWIKEDLKQSNHDSYYVSPKTETFPLDGAFLQGYYPDLSIVNSQDLSELINQRRESNIYLELPEYIDILNDRIFLDNLDAEKIAIISQLENSQKWENIADRIIVNRELKCEIKSISLADLQIHRAGLTQEILDFASLETFWQELVAGAYGDLIRVKGIFNIMDGQCIYRDYLQNGLNFDFQPLQIPLSLQGRPTHFSGLEIIGTNLDKQAIVDTISDFCLPDDIVQFYQQQVKESLAQ